MMTCDSLGTKDCVIACRGVRRCRGGLCDRLKKVLGVLEVQARSSDLEDCAVERILNKRVIKRRRGQATEYLIRWLG